ncbi:uncharacterized protein LOC120609693 isoform X2 [Pteropus medius]|uniref:uncharacterized protein LOC120609693 isoform X2 n=1 Tax=Pteropus vampyrus TaxID=132908 RepID=UPI00196A7059|nr:uncharacterized protein LOC120609693 isoform X2 [Pteropus giganteus]
MSSSHGVHGRGKGGTNCEEPTSQCRCGGRRATSHSRKTLSSEATPGGHSLRLNQTLSLLGQRTRSAGRRRGHQEVEHSSKEPSGIDPPLSPTAPQLPLSIQRKKSLGESWPIPKESGECFGAHSSPPVQLHGGEEVDCQQSGHSSKSGEKCHLMDRHIRLATPESKPLVPHSRRLRTRARTRETGFKAEPLSRWATTGKSLSFAGHTVHVSVMRLF